MTNEDRLELLMQSENYAWANLESLINNPYVSLQNAAGVLTEPNVLEHIERCQRIRENLEATQPFEQPVIRFTSHMTDGS